MKKQIANFKWKTGSFPLVEVNLTKVHLAEGEPRNGVTDHTVSSVETIDGEVVIDFLAKFNHPFEYKGGEPFQEAMDDLLSVIAPESVTEDPTA